MKTTHKVIYENSNNLVSIPSESVDLIVTSPPYPMIEMWDEIFANQNPSIKKALGNGEGIVAFEEMHQILDSIWRELHRVLKYGGFACINIGDATRTIDKNFGLYPNHMRILKYALEIGFTALPCILWRKQTNAPNKFMGSGMLPAGAYVTLEHEYILILRKGPKREFKNEEDKKNRRESAIFWEERNMWYSDVWLDLKGARQSLNNGDVRQRSAAFPYDLAYRLINMYSAKGDMILDPFLGAGTTMAAAITACRNSIGYEIDPTLRNVIGGIQDYIVEFSKNIIFERLTKHVEFVAKRLQNKGDFKYINKYYQFPVLTSQEKELLINEPSLFSQLEDDLIEVEHSNEPQKIFCKDWDSEFKDDIVSIVERLRNSFIGKQKTAQLKLF
jgi:modification methylase